MLEVVVATKDKNFDITWQVIDTDDNCKVLATDLESREEAHAWIDTQDNVKEVK